MGVERGSAGCLFSAALPRPNLHDMSAPPLSRDKARRLSREETDAERRLWMRLRRHQLGVQFRRQHPIGPYIVDFCCVERMLIVELDAGSMRISARRTRHARSGSAKQGFRVLRFSDHEGADGDRGGSHGDSEPPIDPHPNPPPRHGGGCQKSECAGTSGQTNLALRGGELEWFDCALEQTAAGARAPRPNRVDQFALVAHRLGKKRRHASD